MLSEFQQKEVWEGILGAEIRSNYFADLSGRYAMKQKVATWSTLAFSSGSVASLVASLPEIVRLVLAATTAVISAYSVVMQNQKFAVDSADLHARWSRLASDYRRLWDNMYSAEALVVLDGLARRSEELSKSGTSFPNRQRLMEKWELYVVQNYAGPMKAA